MFIKNVHGGSRKPSAVHYKTDRLLSVYSASTLLDTKPHQFLLKQIYQLSGLDQTSHTDFYQSFIYRFVEWVQVIPVHFEEALGSMMNAGLLRGYNALKLYVEQNSESSVLERYAVFTAATLNDIGHLFLNQTVYITDEQGAFLKSWDPFQGPLCVNSDASYYRLLQKRVTQRNLNSLTSLLARQILSEKGFLWLTSNMALFMDWLEALCGEGQAGIGKLVRLLQLIKQNLEQFMQSLPLIEVPLYESPATQYGDAFFSWLKEGIANKQIKVNSADSGIHVVPEGVFIDKQGIFKQFVELYNVPVNMYVVFQQFGNLFGLAKLSGHDYRNAQLFSEHADFASHKSKLSFDSPLATAHQMKEGILINDPHLIFTKGDIPATTPYLKVLPESRLPQAEVIVTSTPENKI